MLGCGATMSCSALVSLTFDDGLRCQFERAVPILNQHGLCATFFLIANTDPIHQRADWYKINWSEEDSRFLKHMLGRGHEIGAHSVTHLPEQIEADPKREAEESKRWIEARLEQAITSYAYPGYQFTTPIKNAVVNAGYQQARLGAGKRYYPLQTPIDFFEVDCREISGVEAVDGWLKPDEWHVLNYHGIEWGFSPISVAEFDRQMTELANHRNAGAVEVVTFREGADRFRLSA
jgi:peptidoglycan/xylan/chitin deacetylase (PgdA/CDA1 family)